MAQKNTALLAARLPSRDGEGVLDGPAGHWCFATVTEPRPQGSGFRLGF